jgi:hypothetical protein
MPDLARAVAVPTDYNALMKFAIGVTDLGWFADDHSEARRQAWNALQELIWLRTLRDNPAQGGINRDAFRPVGYDAADPIYGGR